jgi:hypothetical protein
MKRILVISDGHSGSKTGLTPPKWQGGDENRKKTWDEYVGIVQGLQPIDILVYNGDLINMPNGKGYEFDNLTNDPVQMQEMAAEVIEVAKAREGLIITAGTDSHTGQGMELERQVLDKAQLLATQNNRPYKLAEYDMYYNLTVGKITMNFRHFTGGKSSPMGRPSTASSDRVWNEIKKARGKEDKQDIIIRSHVHYHVYHGDPNGLTIITPCLQLPEARYALKKCTGDVDWGVTYIDVDEDTFSWGTEIRSFDWVKTPEYKV